MALKRPLDSDFPLPPSKIAKTRAFKDSWKIGNSWLRYDPKLKSMFCEICQKAQKSNSFSNGCNILKKENVTKHANSKGMKREIYCYVKNDAMYCNKVYVK